MPLLLHVLDERVDLGSRPSAIARLSSPSLSTNALKGTSPGCSCISLACSDTRMASSKEQSSLQTVEGVSSDLALSSADFIDSISPDWMSSSSSLGGGTLASPEPVLATPVDLIPVGSIGRCGDGPRNQWCCKASRAEMRCAGLGSNKHCKRFQHALLTWGGREDSGGGQDAWISSSSSLLRISVAPLGLQ